MNQKYLATLTGCALGDTLGMAVEGWKKEQIKKYFGKITEPIAPVFARDENGILITKDEFGKIGYYTSDLEEGEFTDDTILTLALAESIVEKNKIDLNDIAKKHVDAYEKCIMPDRHLRGGFGGTTRKGIENLRNGASPLESGVVGGPGNAPAMKMSPIGIYMDISKNESLGLESAEHIAKITHLDPRSVFSGIFQAYAVYSLLKGFNDRENFVNYILEKTSWFEEPVEKEKFSSFPMRERGNLSSRIEWINQNKNVSDEEAWKKLGSSSLVFSSYPFALFMFQKYWNNPIEGLIETINYGGDCDTTGAIYGALCGAKNGMIFPERWILKIKQYERIKNAASGLSEMKIKSETGEKNV